jgi:SAM-dependent methyltransferase
VARAVALGWHAVGIDTDADAIAGGKASGLPLSTTCLEDLVESHRGVFDAVTLSHVLEHVADPVGLLRAARAVLRPTGTLWLVTPNLDARAHRRFGDRWVHLDPPRHLALFNAEALELALAEAGFDTLATPASASGTISSFAQSWRIERGWSPLEVSRVPLTVRVSGLLAGVRSLLASGTAEELIRLARPGSTS